MLDQGKGSCYVLDMNSATQSKGGKFGVMFWNPKTQVESEAIFVAKNLSKSEAHIKCAKRQAKHPEYKYVVAAHN